jgi:hypothetical protein
VCRKEPTRQGYPRKSGWGSWLKNGYEKKI